MARPARVRIRRRKPWVLCRRRLFGWNVRLLTGSSPVCALGVRSCEVWAEPVCRLAPLIRGEHSGLREGAGPRSKPRPSRRECRGQAAPVDTGSTAPRYAVPTTAVKPAKPIHGCGQRLDPQPTGLLAFCPSPRFPTVDASCPALPRRASPRDARKAPLTWGFVGLDREVIDRPRIARQTGRAACTTCGQTCGRGQRRHTAARLDQSSSAALRTRADTPADCDWSGATHVDDRD